MTAKIPRRLIVGITGATGVVYGIRLLQMLKTTDVESHLVISRWGWRTLLHETPYSLAQVRALATRSYAENDQGAALSSGSFLTLGMVIAPCSMKTLSAIAQGQNDDLIHRAADVVLKEKRRLVLMAREAPLSEIHLENMLKLARMGVVIAPPVPAFYNHPTSINDLVDHTVARVLDLFDVHVGDSGRWTGEMAVGARPRIAAVKVRKASFPRASRRARRS
jgi:4-hydroxy-3-polyprenylbenzoate decarboxylase